jgi:hypothetical protein
MGALTVQEPESVDYRDIPRKLKMEYQYPSDSKAHKLRDQLSVLLARVQRPTVDLQELMTDAANLILKQFSLKQVCIAMKGDDGIYRYKVLAGCRPDVAAAMRKLEYSYEQVSDNTTYKGYMISKYTKLFLAEESPWPDDEKETYDLPSLLGMSRRSLDDFVEGDYTNVFIFGRNDETLGWIEFNSTTTRKLLDAPSIQWIEFIGHIIAVAVTFKRQGIKEGP